MRSPIPAVLAALALAAVPASADPAAELLYGGTEQGAIALGGSFLFDAATANGKDLSLELHGGYYVLNAFLVGGSFVVRDDDVADTYELSALGQYHFLNAFDPVNDRPWGVSPYAGLRLGVAHGKDVAGGNTGALAGLRLGVDLFLTDNIALDLAFDWTICSAKVYPDDYRLKKSDATLRLGLDFHF